ncbi:hypothetical protein [Streptomyces sp. CRN 30]|uniref:hypothetical protein n=1 Tax=Streptomyces sp. CRN 30 TaxID=3075613 RepID=UPI002A7F975D|nr:hypothetical protein [Streptomyces sp. CRN 30]
MRRTLALLGTGLTAVALVLTACDDGFEQGPAGQVVAKDRDQECRKATTGSRKKTRDCHWEYELTTRDRDGQEHEFEVPSGVYDSCRRGSAYPSCINR